MTEKELLKQLERELTKEYKDTEAVIKGKIADFTKKFDKENKLYLEKVKNGEIDEKTYKQWYKQQVTSQKWCSDMIKELSEDMTKANMKASDIINGYTSDLYLNGCLEASGEFEDLLGFDLIDRKQIDSLMKENKSLLPKSKVSVPKDEKWNERRMRSAVLQSALKGESIPKLSKRLEHIVGMNHTSSVRNARTMMTSSHNLGKQNMAEEAKEMGINVKKMWIATNDDRTRESHAEMDGVTVDVDETFVLTNMDGSKSELMYPADPDGDPEQVYNCRCTMGYVIGDPDDKSSKEALMDYTDLDFGNAETVMNDTQIEASKEYAQRMGNDDVDKFNKILKEAEYESSEASAYDKVNNVIGIARDGYDGTTIFHESTHWYDYNQNYTLVDDYGHIQYNFGENGDLISKEWIPNLSVIKENVGFSEYISWEWDKLEFNRDIFKMDEFSKAQLDLQNFVSKVGTSDTYGYGKNPEDLKRDMDAINGYLKGKSVSKSDPDFVHLSDFISAISYDANLGSLTTGGHDYNYWTRGSEQRVTEIVAGYNLLRATGREDLINIERDLAPNLMNLIEKEWVKIW